MVDTLEIVIYSLLHADTYREAMQTAVRFGYDTDTYATVLSGLHQRGSDTAWWLAPLKRRDYLEDLNIAFQVLKLNYSNRSASQATTR